MHDAIQSALVSMEQEHGVKVLYACESGSRAWGFASPDSDYDVRFIYVHPLTWYLKLGAQRDVIEAMLPGDLDVSGWDLRKALRLLIKNNGALLEWLHSPIVYCDHGGFRQSVCDLLPEILNPRTLFYHYHVMADRLWRDCQCVQNISLKRLFYVLRTLLAAGWLLEKQTVPPVLFDDLFQQSELPTDLRDAVVNMKKEKETLGEDATWMLGARQRAWINETIAQQKMRVELLATPEKRSYGDLDDLFRRTVMIDHHA
ncbi:MAG: nucleotidyltransferase domain-containing protein [Acidobacteria bacterium]|nr:nucleotidyltransferase domain-containing protein [Acidobacteriota bacterium]